MEVENLIFVVDSLAVEPRSFPDIELYEQQTSFCSFFFFFFFFCQCTLNLFIARAACTCMLYARIDKTGWSSVSLSHFAVHLPPLNPGPETDLAACLFSNPSFIQENTGQKVGFTTSEHDA